MNRIETKTSMHVLVEKIGVPDSDGNQRGRTLCGRTVLGHSGHCVVTMIACRQCRAALRRQGYTI